MKNHLYQYILRLVRDRSGNVVIEMALIMSVFILLMLGGYDISRMAIETHELEQVARSGAQYALLGQTSAQDTATIIAEAKEAAGDDADLITVTATTFCECPDGTGNNCSDTCSDGSVSLMYVNVTVTKPFVFLFNLPVVFGSYTISGSANMRIR
jgi:Flp pilus assembly protein TadG